MAPRTSAFRILGALVISWALSAIAADPAPVYLKSPTDIEEEQGLEAVLRGLPAQKSKWSAFANRSLTYVVKQGKAGLLVPDPCEWLPVRVTIVRGVLRSARYDASAGRCKYGHAASHKSPSGERRYLTPDELFRRVARARGQLACYQQSDPNACLATSLRVTYDEKLGLPTKMEDYSDLVSDYYWSLEVSEIVVVP